MLFKIFLISHKYGWSKLHNSTFLNLFIDVIISNIFYVFSGQSLSRAAYARLYSAGFTPILDRNGEPPEVLDPNIRPTINLARESVDPLQANEIIFQFLAFSKWV